MNNIKFIPSKNNVPINVFRNFDSYKYMYLEESDNSKNRMHYEAFLTDSNAEIIHGDLCIVTEPFDGTEYVEKCDKVIIENGREVFYGQEGTRCLLWDVAKIISADMKSLEVSDFTKLDSTVIIKFINKKPDMWY